jgi:hypothetical protein
MSRVANIFMFCLTGFAAIAVAGQVTKASSLHARSNGSRASHTLTFPVSITPNGNVPLHVACTYTANVSGGTAPYHYAWKVQNVAYGSDSPTISYSSNGGGFHVEVNVTDANNDTGYDSNIMTTGGSSCGS